MLAKGSSRTGTENELSRIGEKGVEIAGFIEARKATYQSLQPTSNTLNPIPNRSSDMFTNLYRVGPQFDVIVD